MQQEEVHVVNVCELRQKYKDFVKCTDIGDGKYELTLCSKNISNKKAREILKAFQDVNISELNF